MLQSRQTSNSVAAKVDACSLRKQSTGVSTACIFVYYGMIICGCDNLRDKRGSGERQGVFWFQDTTGLASATVVQHVWLC